MLKGTRIMSLGEPPKDQLYSHRLKGTSLCFSLLKNALSGGYVNFGVFRLYNDPTLEDALNVFVKLVMSVQSNHLLVGLRNILIKEIYYYFNNAKKIVIVLYNMPLSKYT